MVRACSIWWCIKSSGMMGCLICSQDAGPGFPFLDRTDTRDRSHSLSHIIYTHDLNCQDPILGISTSSLNLIAKPNDAMHWMLKKYHLSCYIAVVMISFARVGFGWQVIDVLSQSQLTVTELQPHLETQKPSQNSFILKLILREAIGWVVNQNRKETCILYKI